MNLSLLRIAVASATIALPALSQDLVAVKAKTIHTMAGPIVEDGVIQKD